MVKVLVTMDETLVRRLDEEATAANLSRSALITRLLNEQLSARTPPGRTPRVRRALSRLDEVFARYSDGPDSATAVRETRDDG